MRRLLMLVAVCAGAGCTPVRSTLPPPYLVDGRSYSAEELDQYASAACARDAGALPPNKFTTDGCSAYRDDGWRACCIKHDVAYWCGAGRRRAADLAFRHCVRATSSAANANLMYGGVRLGGGRFMPFPWRFGYGHPWPHRPAALSPATDVASSEAGPQTAPTSP